MSIFADSNLKVQCRVFLWTSVSVSHVSHRNALWASSRSCKGCECVSLPKKTFIKLIFVLNLSPILFMSVFTGWLLPSFCLCMFLAHYRHLLISGIVRHDWHHPACTSLRVQSGNPRANLHQKCQCSSSTLSWMSGFPKRDSTNSLSDPASQPLHAS